MEDYKLVPFHLLATEGQTYFDKDHVWQMETIHKICQAGPNFLLATPYKIVDLQDEKSETIATNWWEKMTAKGGEGMVVKPLNFIQWTKGELVQPAIKCRGRAYLRIIYGAEYTMPNNLKKLKKED